MHWDMVRHNYTSVESFDYSSPDAWPYDRGLRRNMHEVFGRKCGSPYTPPSLLANFHPPCFFACQRMQHI